MNDLESIKATLDPLSIVSNFGHESNPRQGRNIHCPNQRHAQTGTTPPCAMDYRSGLWKCFGCEAKGDLLDFIGYCLFADYDHSTRPHFKELIDLLSSHQIKPMPERERRERLATAKPTLEWDKAWLADWTDNLLGDKLLVEYLGRRGVDTSITRYQLGYTAQDSRLPAWAWHYITIPYSYRGVYTGVKLRANPFLIKEQDKRFRAIGSFPLPFNADATLQFTDNLIIQESELDSLALGELLDMDKVIGYPAGKLETLDISLLNLVRTPILIADNDQRGRSVASVLKARCHRLKVVYPEDYKDLGEFIVEIGKVIPYWLKGIV